MINLSGLGWRGQVTPSWNLMAGRPTGPTLTFPSLQPPSAKYGGRHTVTMIPGDGIGPELMLHVKSVFRYTAPGPASP